MVFGARCAPKTIPMPDYPDYLVSKISKTMQLEDIIKQSLTVDTKAIKADQNLVKQIQQRLSIFRLYPGGRWIDGLYGSKTESAILTFGTTMGLSSFNLGKIDRSFANSLLTANPVDFALNLAKNRNQVLKDFQQLTVGYDSQRLPLLDIGYLKSPYPLDISTFPLRLKEKPDYQEVISLGAIANLTNPNRTVTFNPYPSIGKLPAIDNNGLNFLHSDITEACVVVGSFVEGEVRTRWLGRSALNSVECWSSTKFINILYVISQINSRFINSDVDNCLVRNPSNGLSYPFFDLMSDIQNYETKIATSNCLAAMFKRFTSWVGLEVWLKQITGNSNLQFSGGYGEDPFIYSPEVFDRKLNQTVLKAAPEGNKGSNSLAVYDLTRMISLLGWHYHIPAAARLPGAQWDSLESLARAMGKDTARHLDFAIDKLALGSVIGSPVVISKMGFGMSTIRNRSEMLYTGLIRFIDKRTKPAKLRTMALTLRAAKALGDEDEEARQLDARMGAEITELLRRLVAEELG